MISAIERDVGTGADYGHVEGLRYQLAVLKARVGALEKAGQHEGSAVEAIARQVDEIRCARATAELSTLLRK
jgi:hypothetical protein